MTKKLFFYLSRNLTQNARGAELHTFINIVNFLSELDFKIYYFGPPAPIKNAEAAVFIAPNIEIGIPILKDVASLTNFTMKCKKLRPDYVIALGGIGTNCLKVALTGRLLSTTSIIRSAGDTLNVHKHQMRFSQKLKFFLRQNLLARVSFALSDHCIVVGEALRDYLCSRKVITKAGSSVIPGYLRRKEFYPLAKTVSREKLNLPAQGRFVGFAGGLDSEKGLDHLVELTAKLPNNIKILIAGEPTVDVADPLLRELIENQNVIFLGVLDSEGLLYFYNSIDVLIFLTKVGGGYGQVNLEAALCKTPVLGLNVGLDVSWLLRGNACSGVDELCNRILDGAFEQIDIEREIFKDENITKSWMNILSE